MKGIRPKFEVSARAGLCLLVLLLTSLDVIHTHAPLNPLAAKPLHAGQHCVICMAAHLPLAVSAGTAASEPVFSAATMLPSLRPLAARQPLSFFSLYIRPPPLG